MTSRHDSVSVPATGKATGQAETSNAGAPAAAALHRRLATLRTRLARLTERHRLIIERYRADILPLETRLTGAVLTLTTGLIDEYTARARDTAGQILLGLWIEDHLKTLDQHPGTETRTVADVSRRWREVIQDGDTMVDVQLAKLRATHERDVEPVPAARVEVETVVAEADAVASTSVAEPVTLLFRRLARRLHPDRENDVDRKAHKDSLMAQCLAARQADDLGALMALCETHVGPVESVIDETQFAAMESRLRLEIRRTEARLARLQSDDPFNAMIVSRYQDDSDEAVLQRFATHRAQLDNALRSVLAHLSALGTPDGLDDLLDERRDLAFDRLTIAELTGGSS